MVVTFIANLPISHSLNNNANILPLYSIMVSMYPLAKSIIIFHDEGK
jgi:hypothetical protein